MILLEFAMEICRIQHEGNRHLVYEHPASADSWTQECVKSIAEMPNVLVTSADQCQYGLKDRISRKPHKKHSKFMTNSNNIAKRLSKRCSGNHEHQVLEGKVKIGGESISRTKLAEQYPDGCPNQYQRICTPIDTSNISSFLHASRF